MSGQTSWDREELARLMHVEHMREFRHLADDDFKAEQCGNCQRWAGYAIAVLTHHCHTPPAERDCNGYALGSSCECASSADCPASRR